MAELLQYTVYAVMLMLLFAIGGNHRADSWSGEPGTVEMEKFNGDDITANEKDKLKSIKYGIMKSLKKKVLCYTFSVWVI